MTNTATYIITNSGSIDIIYKNEAVTIGRDHINYDKIIDVLKSKNYDALDGLLNISKAIVTFSNDRIQIKDGLVWYDKFIVDDCLTRRIIELNKGGYPFEPMINMLHNCMANPNPRALHELYTFLDANSLPITEDGCFLAYKRVRDDYKDFYTGQIDNSIGKTPSMSYKDVNANKDVTCSYGLHVCSLSYLSHYHSGRGRIIIVKVNPKDVVSVPTDYNNTKMRTCAYTVVANYDENTKKLSYEKEVIKEKFDKPLYNDDSSEYYYKNCCRSSDATVTFHNKRDSKGRFAKK
jgi:hypothetical protein